MAQRIRVGTVGHPGKTTHPYWPDVGHAKVKAGTPVVICYRGDPLAQLGALLVRVPEHEPEPGELPQLTLSRAPVTVAPACSSGLHICMATFEDLFGILPETFRELYEEPSAESNVVGDWELARAIGLVRDVNKQESVAGATEEVPTVFVAKCVWCDGTHDGLCLQELEARRVLRARDDDPWDGEMGGASFTRWANTEHGRSAGQRASFLGGYAAALAHTVKHRPCRETFRK